MSCPDLPVVFGSDMSATSQDEKDAELLTSLYGEFMRTIGTLGIVCGQVADFRDEHESIGGTVHLLHRHLEQQIKLLRAGSQEAEGLIARLAKTDRESFREAAEELIAERSKR